MKEITDKLVRIWLWRSVAPTSYLSKLIDEYGLIGFYEEIKRARCMPSLPEGAYSRLVENIDLEQIIKEEESAARAGVSIITPEEASFPRSLDVLKWRRPHALFCEGNLSLLEQDGICIVGSRLSSNYGKQMAQRLAADVARSGLVVISGLATGIDGYSHAAALDVGGKTIAVLGGGVKNIYPTDNIPLARRLLDNGGLIISEYGLHATAAGYNFTNRNRITTGLSRAVVVVEADVNSGSMSSADWATKLNLPLYAVCGNQTTSRSEGTNQLIIDRRATMLVKSEQIFNDLKISMVSKKVVELNLTDKERIIYDAIGLEERKVDELISLTALTPRELMASLTAMELGGVIIRLPSNTYAVKR